MQGVRNRYLHTCLITGSFWNKQTCRFLTWNYPCKCYLYFGGLWSTTKLHGTGGTSWKKGPILERGNSLKKMGTPWKKWELCGTVGNLFLVTGGTSSYIWVVWNTLINVLILLLKSIFYRLAVFVIKATQTINHENLRNVYKCVKKLTSWWQITRE